ncbi:MAG: hypothetical protein IT270_18835, partial [Saprospiraceae bacterium]|nr:hypothetical protein [Saprospiraceae bacterium]
KWRTEQPPMPWEVEKHLMALGLQPQDARLICQEKATADYLLSWLEKRPETPARGAANLLIQKIIPWSNASGIALADCPVPATVWTILIDRVETGVVSATAAFSAVSGLLAVSQQLTFGSRQSAEEYIDGLIEKLGLRQTNDDDFLSGLADMVLQASPEKVTEYQKGKKGLMGFFMGELMKASKGKADPKAATKILTNKLERK